MDDSPLDRPLEKPRADTGEGRARLAHACLMLARQLERERSHPRMASKCRAAPGEPTLGQPHG
jgi:hypothetical protein